MIWFKKRKKLYVSDDTTELFREVTDHRENVLGPDHPAVTGSELSVEPTSCGGEVILLVLHTGSEVILGRYNKE